MTQLTPIEFNAFSLYVKFDFRKAQEMLEKCTTVLENDFFLRNYTEQVRGHFVAFRTYSQDSLLCQNSGHYRI